MPRQLVTETVPWSALRPHPENPRNGDTQAIVESLRAHGQYRPIVIATDGTILAGNHTYAAAGELGWESLDVVRLDLAPDDPEALQIMLVDNRTADLGRYDEAGLLALLDRLEADAALTGSGYTEDDLDHLRKVLDSLPPLDTEDDDFDPTLLWPVVKARLHPDLHQRWCALPGADDSDRLTRLLGGGSDE